MTKEINIVIVGVGGQGTLVAGKLLGVVAMKSGLDVKVSEVHGMSQRGGSVVTYVRIGKKVFSPVVEKGGADFILAFEELEAIRQASFLSENGKLIVNQKNMEPITVKTGSGVYPEDIISKLTAASVPGANVISLPAESAAVSLGNVRSANMVMIGAMSVFAGIELSIWMDALNEVFPPKLRELNKNAFESGRNLVCNSPNSSP